MKKVKVILFSILMIISLCACVGEKKILTCDGCGAEIKVPKDSNVTDEWLLYCHDCEVKFGLDKLPN